MTVNHAERMSSLFISNQLDQFLQAIESLYPKGAFIRTGLHPERGLYCRIDDATRSRPGLVVWVGAAVDGHLQHFEVANGSEIRTGPYVSGE